MIVGILINEYVHTDLKTGNVSDSNRIRSSWRSNCEINTDVVLIRIVDIDQNDRTRILCIDLDQLRSCRVLDENAAVTFRQSLTRTDATKRDVVPIEHEDSPARAAVDAEDASCELHYLSIRTRVDSCLDLRIVILRAAKWGERLVDRGAMRNTAARRQSRLGPIGHPTGRDDLPGRQSDIGACERCERALPATLLGACRPRPDGCGAAKQGDELAASHVRHGTPSLSQRNNHQHAASSSPLQKWAESPCGRTEAF